MDSKSPLEEKKDGLISRIRNSIEKSKSGGILPEIARKILGSDAQPDVVDSVASVLGDLFSIGDLKLPLEAIKKEQYKDEFGTQARDVLATILAASGHPALALASSEALKIIKGRIDECGARVTDQPVKGPSVRTNADGADVVLYFVEKDGSVENLPEVDGDRAKAAGALDQAFANWASNLDMEVSRVFDHSKANLIVTGFDFGTSTTMLAKTDIGPPRGIQLRMIFNTAKKFTRDQFISNAGHEFGHALGVFHEDVDQGDRSLIMHGTNLGVTDPQDADVDAAVRRGWKR